MKEKFGEVEKSKGIAKIPFLMLSENSELPKTCTESEKQCRTEKNGDVSVEDEKT